MLTSTTPTPATPPNSPGAPTLQRSLRLPQKRVLLRRLRVWTVRGFATFGFLVAVYALCFDLSVMVSPSMSPTLKGTSIENGDRILTEKVSIWFCRPRRLEVITFLNNEGVRVMKRVVGLPGEEVQVTKEGSFWVNGEPIELPASVDRKYLRYGNLTDLKPVPCGDGYYVLGDFTSDSDDSRFNGPVKPSRILGRAWLIVSPWSRFGFVR
jgi:signal peptidase I